MWFSAVLDETARVFFLPQTLFSLSLSLCVCVCVSASVVTAGANVVSGHTAYSLLVSKRTDAPKDTGARSIYAIFGRTDELLAVRNSVSGHSSYSLLIQRSFLAWRRYRRPFTWHPPSALTSRG